MRTLPIRWPDVDNIPVLAEKYVYLFFDYLRAAYTQPINKTEFEQHLSKIKDQSAALLLTLRTIQWQVVEALNSHRPTISDPVWVSCGTADAWRKAKLFAVVE